MYDYDLPHGEPAPGTRALAAMFAPPKPIAQTVDLSALPTACDLGEAIREAFITEYGFPVLGLDICLSVALHVLSFIRDHAAAQAEASDLYGSR